MLHGMEHGVHAAQSQLTRAPQRIVYPAGIVSPLSIVPVRHDQGICGV